MVFYTQVFVERPVVYGALQEVIFLKGLIGFIDHIEIYRMEIIDAETLLQGDSFGTVEWLLIARAEVPVPVAVDIVLHIGIDTCRGIVDGACTNRVLSQRGITPHTDETADGVIVELKTDIHVMCQRRFQVRVVDGGDQWVGCIIDGHQVCQGWSAHVHSIA